MSIVQPAPAVRHPDPPPARRAVGVLGVVARLVTAVVFIAAGLAKAGDPAGTVRAVRAYRLLPEAAVPAFAHALPWVELAVAALLLAGLATRAVAGLAALLLAAFVAAVASAGARGLRIDCGCFGGGGTVAQTHYLTEIARDLVLLAVALVAAAVRPRLALDTLLATDRETP